MKSANWVRITAEPAFALAMLTGFSYLVGWTCLAAYYRVFGLNVDDLHLPTSTILMNSLPAFMLGSVYLCVSLYKPEDDRDRWNIFLNHMPLFVLCFFALVVPLRSLGEPFVISRQPLAWIGVGLMLLLIALFTKRRIHFSALVMNESWLCRILIFVLFYALIGLLSTRLGTALGFRKVARTDDRAIRVSVTLQPGSPIKLPDRPLVLIHANTESLYVAPVRVTRGEPVETHVIPAREAVSYKLYSSVN